MSNFEYGNPEEQGLPPLDRARRSDLYKYAKAYGVPYTVNCKKDAILPIMKDAEARGVFSKPPAHPEFLLHPAERRKIQAGQAPAPEPVAAEVAPSLTIKWRGPHDKFCVMQGGEVISKGHTKEEAEGLV